MSWVVPTFGRDLEIKSVVVQNQLRISWGARRDMVGQWTQVCDRSGSDRLLVGVSSESGPSISEFYQNWVFMWIMVKN